MTSPILGSPVQASFDPQKPFKHVVVCCTCISPDERSDIDDIVNQLGGSHKYDLTPQITHLVVGNYDSEKYRHVAKERPDVVPMAAGWIQAMMDLWKEDQEIDFAQLESTWRMKPLESAGGQLDPVHSTRSQLLVCLSGYLGESRETMIRSINENGGNYTGDLTKIVTHLIVHKPEGKKFDAAQDWGDIRCVTRQWLTDSLQRGMILEEKYYNPLLPPEKIGRGAWTRTEVTKMPLGKRLRDGGAVAPEEGQRKLRKTASLKINSQSRDMWESILGASTPADYGAARHKNDDQSHHPLADDPTQRNPRITPVILNGTGSSKDGHNQEQQVFLSSAFYSHGYTGEYNSIVINAIRSLGGRLCTSLDELCSLPSSEFGYRFLVVPQSSQPDTHPPLPDDGVTTITEFYLERCLHKKRFFPPHEHVLGKPFPQFPVPGFNKLSISIGGFTDVDLQQVEKAITQIGASFSERFTPQSSVLVCNNLGNVRQQKINLGLAWKVPILKADWLWECIQRGDVVPIRRYLIPQLHQSVDIELQRSGDGSGSSCSAPTKGSDAARRKGDTGKAGLRRTGSEPVKEWGAAKAKISARFDPTAFDRLGATKETSDGLFETANEHLSGRSKGLGSLDGEFVSAESRRGGGYNVEMRDAFRHEVGTATTTKGKGKGRGKVAVNASGFMMDMLDEEAEEVVNVDEDMGDALAVGEQEEPAESEEERLAREREELERKEREVAEVAKRKEMEAVEKSKREKAAKRKAEMTELEEKLGSLIDGGSSSHTSAPGAVAAAAVSSSSAAAAAAAGPGAGGGGDGNDEDFGLGGLNGGVKGRRKRGVFGRAISNTSLGSSGSLSEGSYPKQVMPGEDGVPPVPAVPVELGGKGAVMADGVESQNSAVGSGGVGKENVGSSGGPPPATQVGYEDAEQKRRRLLLMCKMSGDSSSDGKGGLDGMAGGDEKLTMRDYELALQAEEAIFKDGGKTRGARRGKRVPGF